MENVLGPARTLADRLRRRRCGSSTPTGPTLTHQLVTVDKPADEPWSVWAYYAVALFGAALTPYEVFFFSSGGVEERWSVDDLSTMRLNVFIGFPLGGVLSLAIAGCTCGWSSARSTPASTPSARSACRSPSPSASSGWRSRSSGSSRPRSAPRARPGCPTGYSIAQYFGWQWGKYVRPPRRRVFHLVLVVVDPAGHRRPRHRCRPHPRHRGLRGVLGRRPAAHVLPDPGGRQRPGLHGRARQRARWPTASGMVYLVLIGVAAVAAIPLMIWTRMGWRPETD